MTAQQLRNSPRPFSGYEIMRADRVDVELTHVEKGSPGGEYLRRFWHPIALSSDLKDLPKAIKILGEELVLFRDGSGQIGLLHKYCSHRGMSLEFGLIVEHGIRCGYHGWHYGIDGRIVAAPAEEQPGAIGQRICHGAYPTREFKGFVFAYFGPHDATPEFPIYDFMAAAGEDCVPYCWPLPANWVQVRENAQDPIHLTFLHSMFAIKQFGDFTPDIPYIRAYSTPIGQITTSVRRMDDILYCRVNELILPNVAKVADTLRQGNAIAANRTERARAGSNQLLYKRQLPASHGLGFSMWVVPIDNESCLYMGYHHVPQDEDAEAREQHIQQIFFGQTCDRPYEERQRNPGDYDAFTSPGKIVCRDNDILTTADAGIALFRHQLREGIRAVQAGQIPKGIVRAGEGVIPTYAYAITRPAPPLGSEAEEMARKVEYERESAERILAFRVPHTPRIYEPA